MCQELGRLARQFPAEATKASTFGGPSQNCRRTSPKASARSQGTPSPKLNLLIGACGAKTWGLLFGCCRVWGFVQVRLSGCGGPGFSCRQQQVRHLPWPSACERRRGEVRRVGSGGRRRATSVFRGCKSCEPWCCPELAALRRFLVDLDPWKTQAR